MQQTDFLGIFPAFSKFYTQQPCLLQAFDFFALYRFSVRFSGRQLWNFI